MSFLENPTNLKPVHQAFELADFNLRLQLLNKAIGLPRYPADSQLISQIEAITRSCLEGFTLAQRSEAWSLDQIRDLVEITPVTSVIYNFIDSFLENDLGVDIPEDCDYDSNSLMLYLISLTSIATLSSMSEVNYLNLTKSSQIEVSEKFAEIMSRWERRPDGETIWNILRRIRRNTPHALAANPNVSDEELIRTGHFLSVTYTLLEDVFSSGSNSSNLLFPESD